MRLRLGIAYDGSAFHGWARQPDFRTVQVVLEDALATLFRDLDPPPALTVAGRTDTGVHAIGQVAHLEVPEEALVGIIRRRNPLDPSSLSSRDEADALFDEAIETLRRRLVGIIGNDSDLSVMSVERVSGDFDARFSALWRRYEYRIADSQTPPNPLERIRTTRVTRSLDVDAMNEASGALLGLHDFATFCKQRPDSTTIRTLQAFSWIRDEQGYVVANVQADAFCHSMVRALVGIAVAAGDGSLTLADVTRLLAAAERTSEFAVMPAKGLTLVEVRYPADSELGSRATATRNRRISSSN